MKKNKITITYSEGKGFNISTINNNTPMCYAELSSFMYDIANAMAEYDRDANNECEENPQMTESDKNLRAIQLTELTRAQEHTVHAAKVFMGMSEPIVGDMLNLFRMLGTIAFLRGWNACFVNLDAVKKTIEEDEQ